MTTVVLGQAYKAWRNTVRLGRSIARLSLERQAKSLTAEAVRRGSGLVQVPEEDGYTKFQAGDLSGVGGSLPGLLELAQGWTSDESRIRDEMPRNILKTEDLFDHPEIVRIALHDDILAAVSGYLGQVPRLFNLFLWWSPPNQSAKLSQLYHYDHRDNRQAKVFINLSDVTDKSGPLHFLTAKDSQTVNAKVGYSQGRYTDEEVYSAVPESKVLKATGAANEAFIVDTGRCLHYGSRGNEISRFILMVSFARVNSVKPGKGCRVLDPVREKLAREFFASDPVRKLALTAPM